MIVSRSNFLRAPYRSYQEQQKTLPDEQQVQPSDLVQQRVEMRRGSTRRQLCKSMAIIMAGLLFSNWFAGSARARELGVGGDRILVSGTQMVDIDGVTKKSQR